VIRLLGENRTQHHRNLRPDHKRRGCKVAGRDATAREHIDFVRADHLAVNSHRLLRLRAIILDDKLDLAARDAALCVERRDRDFDAVAPSAIHGRCIAGKTGRHPDLVDVLRARPRNRG
jgi:hypothetical protein